MAHDDLTKYFARLDEHNRKWERIEFFAMGFCLGGGLCTVLMYIVQVLGFIIIEMKQKEHM